MLKKTYLNAAHLALGAKMVDFGGWEMPVNYGSQINEHLAVRQNAGMFDVSHMRAVDFKTDESAAPGAIRDFIRHLVANNVDKLKNPGKALYSCLLNESGCVLDDLIVYFLNENHFRIVVNAGTADKDIAWFQKQLDASGANIVMTPRSDLSMLAVQGPNARAKVWEALPETKSATESMKPFNGVFIGDTFVARTGYTGEDGFELTAPHEAILSLWNKLLELGVQPCGLGARDTLRLEAGMNLYGNDMDETVTPLESGLAWTVDLVSDRDFTGKAALVAQKPSRNLYGLLLLDRGVLRGHQTVHTPGGEGMITSGTFSPTMNQSIALARLPNATQTGDAVEVDVRGKRLKAKVVKIPFVRNGKVLVETH
jgi:aminomethyltransferase